MSQCAQTNFQRNEVRLKLVYSPGGHATFFLPHSLINPRLHNNHRRFTPSWKVNTMAQAAVTNADPNGDVVLICGDQSQTSKT